MTPLERVMHVEDDPSISLVTRVTLEKLGKLKVLSCESGIQALEQFRSFDPQVILLDVMMPGMDGPTTLIELKKLLDVNKILVLFMTAKVQEAEKEYYRSLGARDVIMKPFDPMTLPTLLQTHWQNFQESGT